MTLPLAFARTISENPRMSISDDDLVDRLKSGDSCSAIAADAGVSRQAITQRANRMIRLGRVERLRSVGAQLKAPSEIRRASDRMLVSLSDGIEAVISPEDVDLVKAYRWHLSRRGSGIRYAATRIDGRHVYMHRLISDAPAGKVVDHCDGDGLNNRRENIRVCTQADNMMNRRGNVVPRVVA